ncbi:MAG TPA: hypothetical protein VHM70_09995 [Polyangiaceae bacterium]|nr:hypothetical protein [Polyangiaceae bacterium]
MSRPQVAATLELSNCCVRELNWECELERRELSNQLVAALLPLGYRASNDSGFVVELVHTNEHRVVVVPRTGRVQLRLAYTTPQPERRGAAEQLLRQIVDALAEFLAQSRADSDSP